ncbi:CHAT domain-containing protein [Apiospora sp. TS-2023a]
MSDSDDTDDSAFYVVNPGSDMDSSIDKLERMVDEHPEDSETRATLLSFLADYYYQRFAQGGEDTDLDNAIEALQEADEISTDETNRASRLGTLGQRLYHRSTRTGEVSDIDAAVDALRVVIDIDTDPPTRASYLGSLGQSLRDKYNKSGGRCHLEEAIQRTREAAQTSADGHPERCTFLCSLGILLAQKYAWTGDIEDINEAIREGRRAVLAAPEDSKRATCLNNVGHQLREKYFRTGDIEDLDNAVLHSRIGALADLTEAIEAGQRAVAMIPTNQMDRSKILHNLGMTLHRRYARTESADDLDESIRLITEAVNTNDEKTSQPLFLNSLGSCLGDRYADKGETSDLRGAIKCMKQAIELAPEDHADRGIWLSNLGTLLDPSYTFSWANGASVDGLTDPEEAINVSKQAIEATPESHPTRATFTYSLARRLVRKLRAGKGDNDCLAEAIARLREVLVDQKPPTLMRILAGKSILEESMEWNEALQASKIAVQLMPTLTSKSLRNADKQQLLGQLAGFASDAAAMALYEQGPHAAIELLEQGRGVLAASLNEMRADALDLRKKHPGLSERFEYLRGLLAQPIVAPDGPFPRKEVTLPDQAPTDQRYNAGKDLDSLLREIRQLAGFENFLGPPNESEMREAATRGPIVVINVSEFRCDALLLTKDGLKTLELEKLTLYRIEEYAQKDNLGRLPVLEWLWDAIAFPVLEVLGFRDSPSDDNWPHVWWVTTGTLSKFPIHAAGNHMKRSSETVLDRVVSSYSSSIRAIIETRRQSIADSKSIKALLVAMDHTPGWDPLPSAAKEVTALRSLCGSMNIQTVEPQRCRKDEIMSHLPQCAVFHFAGHGSTDSLDPSRSYLCLEDGKNDPLMVETLLDMNLRDHSPFLAYLSACGTGRLNVMKFMDESIHLISAFQLAGYRHVIGTLWNVEDDICVDLARTTYAEIGKSGDLEDEAVARGLHMAVRKQRDIWYHETTAQGAKRSTTSHSREPTSEIDHTEGDLTGGQTVKGSNVVGSGWWR